MIATTPQDSSHTACQPTGDGHCTLADRGFHLIGIGGAGVSGGEAGRYCDTARVFPHNEQ